MGKLKRRMLPVVIVIIAFYIIINLVLFMFQDSLIFYPRKLVYRSRQIVNNKENEIKINVDGIMLHGWLLNKNEEKLIIYYGGNADELSANIPDMKYIEGYSVLLMNYRGYGMSEGKPSEKVLFSDALHIYDHITSERKIRPENVVLFGRSLGSGVAVYVASKRDVSKLILATPHDSFVNIGKQHFPIIPVGLIIRHKFDSMKYARHVSSPALFLMGTKDRTIPNKNSLNLANSWQGDCRTVLIEQADHNDIQMYPEYWRAITEFLNE